MLMIAIAALLAGPAPAQVKADPFVRLSALQGQWRGKSSSGRALDISYRLISGGTALVETWRSASGRETMTVYHKDGPALLATHYCAQGNQPRLLLQPTADGGFRFTYKDATNLASPADSHLVDFRLAMSGPDRMVRSETYAGAGAAETETAELVRVGS